MYDLSFYFMLIPPKLFKFKIKTLRVKEIINMNTLTHVYTCNSLMGGKNKKESNHKEKIKYSRAEEDEGTKRMEKVARWKKCWMPKMDIMKCMSMIKLVKIMSIKVMAA